MNENPTSVVYMDKPISYHALKTAWIGLIGNLMEPVKEGTIIADTFWIIKLVSLCRSPKVF